MQPGRGAAEASGTRTVDPLSVGVLATITRSRAALQVETSVDGGSTWALGAVVSATGCNCRLAFAGPSPRTLYNVGGGLLSVSHDAGLSWAATHPAPAGDGPIVGSRPAVALSDNDAQPTLVSLSYTADEGATYSTVPLAAPAGVIGVDPTDPSHVLLAQQDDRTTQSWDAGRTTSDLADARFGMMGLGYAETTGAGSVIYAALGDTIWSSRDRGASWTRTQLPAGSNPKHILVSRDDPRSAYLQAAVAGVLEGMRTRDGGATWQVIANPVAADIGAIAPGFPDHVFAGTEESTDGGVTWTPGAATCPLAVVADPSSATGNRIACAAYGPDGTIASTSPVTATSQGIFGVARRAGGARDRDVGPARRRRRGRYMDIAAHSDRCLRAAAATRRQRPRRLACEGRDDLRRRRLDHGRELGAPRRRTLVAAAGLRSQRRPDRAARRHACDRDDGRPTGRVGAPVRRHSARRRRPRAAGRRPAAGGEAAGRADLRRALEQGRRGYDGLRVAARRRRPAQRDAAAVPVDVTRPRPRPHLPRDCDDVLGLGRGHLGGRLRRPGRARRTAPASPHRRPGRRLAADLQRAKGITWLRAGRIVKGAHGRSYRVRKADRGVAIACRTRLADGTVVQSRSARIARVSGS